MLEGAVEGKAARAQVGAGKATITQLRSVRAAAHCRVKGLKARSAHGGARVFNQEGIGRDLLLHVAVLVAQSQGDGAFAPALVHHLRDVAQLIPPRLKARRIMVAHDVDQPCAGHVARHFLQMEETLVALGLSRRFGSGQHGVEFHGQQACVDHGVFGAAGMHVHAAKVQGSFAGVEVFIA